jgi:hypothetical protein
LSNFLYSPVTSFLFGPNILLRTLFSNTLSLCSFFNVRGQVSHPYRITGRNMVLYIVTFIFLDNKRKDKRLWTEWYQTFPEFIMLLISSYSPYKTIILPVVLYGCETLSLTFREKRRLRVFENRVLRRIYGPNRNEVTGEWRKFPNEELNNLYSSPDIISQIKSRRMRWAGHVVRMGEEIKLYEVLVGKPEGRRPLGRPRHRWYDENRMDLREIGLGGVDWIRLAQDRDQWRAVVSEVMNLRVSCSRELVT